MEFDIEKFKNPSPLFKIFEPTQEKLMLLSKKLMTERFYLDDTLRDYDIIWRLLSSYFLVSADSFIPNLFYEIGDSYGGLIGFTNIIPKYRCSVFIRLWDKKLWSAGFVKEAKKLADFIMEQFKLERMESESADLKIHKMAKIGGFKIEGEQEKGFKWDGVFYTNYLIAKIKEE